MNNSHDARIVHLAAYLRQVMDHLGLPEDVLAKVDHLLEQGPAAAPALEALLARNPATQAWMREALGYAKNLRSGYAPLPGLPESPAAAAYCCPVEGCPAPAYIPFQAGEPIPPCPLHRAPLEPCAAPNR